jgi:hypothetical protein
MMVSLQRELLSTFVGIMSLLMCLCHSQSVSSTALQASHPDPFVMVSIPKSGTHLLSKCLRKMTGLRGIGLEKNVDKEDSKAWVKFLATKWKDNIFSGFLSLRSL